MDDSTGCQRLNSLSDDELLRRTADLLHASRRIEADLVAHIGEVDARRLYARFAASSMFGYCTEILHLSEHEAYLRMTAARAARRHPILLAMLRDGRLHLATVARLAAHLTPENRDAVLARAIHRSKREVEELIAELSPAPDAPTVVRKLPERRSASEHLAALAPPAAGVDGRGQVGGRCCSAAAAEVTRPVYSIGPVVPGVGPVLHMEGREPELVPERVARPASPRTAAANRASVEPIAPARYKVQFTATAALKNKLERLQALMRASVPDGDLSRVIEDAVTEKLARLEARRFGRARPHGRSAPGQEPAASPGGSAPRAHQDERSTAPAASGTRSSARHVPAAVRAAVHERDGCRCRYVDEMGRRCSERSGLEFHHRRPFGHGGEHTADNISLVCRAHNRYLAEVDYGRDMIRRPGSPRGPVASQRG